jgi:hypothetical protein
MPVDETTRLRPNGWSSLEVKLVDLSDTGFRAECEATILCGSAIRIALPGLGEIEAQVTWRRRGEIGAKFIVPIDLSRCTAAKLDDETVLARLLVERAEARSTGRFTHEQKLRRQILGALPMRRVEP